MPFEFFCVPVRDDDTVESEPNAFVRSDPVLAVDRRWVTQGAESFLSFSRSARFFRARHGSLTPPCEDRRSPGPGWAAAGDLRSIGCAGSENA